MAKTATGRAAVTLGRADKKSRTRAKIVEHAARLLRTQGLEKPAIDDVMAAADLTRGGFYAHFANRDALVAEALNQAFDDAHKHMFFTGEYASSPKASLHGLAWAEHAAKFYLSEGHLHESAMRCPVPALASEVARAAPVVRDVFTENIRIVIEATAGFLGSAKNKRDRERAIHLLSSWFGAMTVARAVNDEALALEIMESCKRETMREIEKASAPKKKKRSAA